MKRDLVSLMFDPATLAAGFDSMLADHRPRRPYVPRTRTHHPESPPKKKRKR
jgi:hypothetical protein